MLTGFRMVLLCVASLLHAAALADDAAISKTDDDRVSAMPSKPSTKLPLTAHSSNWRPSRRIEPMAYSSVSDAALSDLDFQDPDAFSRVSKLRELSLVTLAEIGRSRLFLGVNKKGLLGLHLGDLSSLGDDRCLELVRLPYLKDPRHDPGAR